MNVEIARIRNRLFLKLDGKFMTLREAGKRYNLHHLTIYGRLRKFNFRITKQKLLKPTLQSGTLRYKNKLYTYKEFAALIGVSYITVWRGIKKGLSPVELKKAVGKPVVRKKVFEDELFEGCDPETIRKLKSGEPL